MLNIFWIHSHITFLLSKEIISSLPNSNEIIILLSRNYELPIDLESKKNISVIRFPWYSENIKKGHNILIKTNIRQTRENIKECKKILNKYINNRGFILFTPTSREEPVGLLIKHEQCQGYYFIEEGTLSYIQKEEKRKKNTIVNLICRYIYNLPYLGMLNQQPNFIGTYATSNDAFPWNKKEKNVITLSKSIATYTDPKYSNIDTIFVFDHLNMSVEYLAIYIDLLCDFIKEQKISNFAYKFHPATKKDVDKENIIREKLKIFKAYELPSSFIIELFLIDKNISVYCFNTKSSISIYAKRLGSKCFLLNYKPDHDTNITLTNC